MARPKGTKKDRQPIYPAEFKRVIELIRHSKKIQWKTKLKLIRACTLLFYSGARISEIASLNIDDFKRLISNRSHILSTTKTKTTQVLKFNQKAISEIAKLDISDCKEALFYKNGTSKPMNSQGLEKLINKYLKEHLNVLYTTHSFRAGYITQIEEASNIAVAQKLARHKDRRTTVRYIGATPGQIDNALDSVFS